MKMILLSCVSFVRSRVSASLVEQSDFLKLRNWVFWKGSDEKRKCCNCFSRAQIGGGWLIFTVNLMLNSCKPSSTIYVPFSSSFCLLNIFSIKTNLPNFYWDLLTFGVIRSSTSLLDHNNIISLNFTRILLSTWTGSLLQTLW